jgi:hypothetical protein
MTTRSTQRTIPPCGPWFLAALLVAPSAFGASPATPMDARVQAQRDHAVCTSVRGDERDNCLSEASTRRASTRPSRADENPEQLARNALRRCEPLREPDRKDCVARMQGQGTTTGSVAVGGIYRELVTREVGPVPAAASGPSVPPATDEAAK